MYPKLYTSNEINFRHNGEGILKDISTPKVTLEANGLFELEFSYPIFSLLFNKLDYGSIVKINASKKLHNQLFRVYKISKPLNGIVKFNAQHISYDLFGNFVEKVSLKNTSCNNALNKLLSSTIYPHKFKALSDITSSANYEIERVNPLEAIIGTKGSIIDTFGNGAKIVRDNFDIKVLQNIGYDNNVLISYGKNLTDLNIDGDITKVVTGIYPFATLQGGIDSETNIQQDVITLPEKIIYSDKKADYYQPFIIPVDFSGDDVKDVNNLRSKSSRYFSDGKDELKENYKISFLDTSSTVNYDGWEALEAVDLYDLVIVRDFRYGVNYKVRVIKTIYLPLEDRYESVELGTQKSNIASSNKNESDSIKEEINKTNNFWKEAIEHATSQITGNSGGYVKVWPPDKPSEIFIMDTDNPNTSKNILRMNKQGIGFSNNGINGPFKTAWTSDGTFYADFITAGILSTIMLQNMDGSLQIDLGSSKGIMTKKNGKNSIELAGTTMRFFDWDGLGDSIGQLYSSRLDGNENVPGIVLANKLKSYLSLAYEKDGNFYSYIRCDKDNIDDVTKVPITIFQETEFRGSQMWYGYDINSIYNSTTNNFVNKIKNNFIVLDKDSSRNRLNLSKNQLNLYDVADNTNRYCLISPSETFFGSSGQKYFSARPDGFSFWKNGDDILYTTTADNIRSEKSLYIDKDLTVVGNKNCVQSTQNYGDRLYYSLEDCESYLTDRSMHLFSVQEVVTDGIVTYERVILLDNIFKESVRCDLDYTIEVIKQGWGDYRVKEQNKDYFIVESNRKDFTFKYIITAKRNGFESVRNEEFYTGFKDEDIANTEYWRLYVNNSFNETII